MDAGELNTAPSSNDPVVHRNATDDDDDDDDDVATRRSGCCRSACACLASRRQMNTASIPLYILQIIGVASVVVLRD